MQVRENSNKYIGACLPSPEEANTPLCLNSFRSSAFWLGRLTTGIESAPLHVDPISVSRSPEGWLKKLSGRESHYTNIFRCISVGMGFNVCIDCLLSRSRTFICELLGTKSLVDPIQFYISISILVCQYQKTYDFLYLYIYQKIATMNQK